MMSSRHVLENLPKLDPEFKAKWVAALRSGDYKQGYSQLCTRDSHGEEYCCLGLAAVVSGLTCKDMGDLPTVTPEIVASRPAFKVYPKALIAGGPDDVSKMLARRNDGTSDEREDTAPSGANRWTFREIADWVERYL